MNSHLTLSFVFLLKKIVFIVLVFLLVSCVTVPALPVYERPTTWAQPVKSKQGIHNLYRVSPLLYRSEQPSQEGFAYLNSYPILFEGDQPVQTIVSLRWLSDDRALFPEKFALQYQYIPVKTWAPQTEDVVAFLQTVKQSHGQPVLVHCLHGADRTGLMVASYRIIFEQWTKAQAIAEMTQGGYGFHVMWSNMIDFINDMDVENIKKQAMEAKDLTS